MEEKKKEYKTGLTKTIKWLLALAVFLFLFAMFSPYIFTKSSLSDNYDFSDTGEIGDTIGGLMSPFINLSAVIVTGLAFYMQYTANRLQVHTFTDQLNETKRQFTEQQSSQDTQNKVQQFESQFFEMLRLHKANVEELSIISIGGVAVSKRQAFVTMAEEFKIFLSYINFGDAPFKDEYKKAYDIFFWGWNGDYVDMDALSSSWFRIIEGPRKDDSDYSYPIDFREYNGYASSLGHYFRHLFMMVKFVADNSAVTDYGKKMNYLKILRAQLSNHEQIILFYNWLSPDYGGAWEDEKSKFFTEYKMIHNLWVGELYRNQYIVDAVNGLIDKYNLNPKETPLFEFQKNDFHHKMDNIEDKPMADHFES